LDFYLPRHDVGVAGNILIAGTVHGICPVSVCLQIKNPFNISGMDEATLIKFGKWIDYGKSHRRGENFPMKGAWSVSRDPFKNLKPPLILFSGMNQAISFKFGRWIDYGKSYTMGKIPPETGVV